MKKSIHTLLLSMLIISVTSCKKEQPIENVPDKLDLLQNKNWVISSLTMNSANDSFTIYLNPCALDNIYRFNYDNRFMLDEGEAKCSTLDDQTINGHWDYDLPTNKLHFYMGSSSPLAVHFHFTIQSISENALTLIRKDTVGAEIWTDTWNFLNQ